MNKGRLTLITSNNPSHVGKEYRKKPDGIKKSTLGQLIHGSGEVVEFSTVYELSAILQGVSTKQAITASLPINGNQYVDIVTENALRSNPGSVSRTREHFGFPSSPGVLILDYDPPDGESLSRNDLWERLQRLVPSISGAGALWWASGSSFIRDGDTVVSDLRGQRVYVLILDLGDTERIGQVLAGRCWLMGWGRIEVSVSGSKLVREMWDQAMFQPARLDFVGGAVLHDGLTQHRGAPVVLSDGSWWRSTCEELTPAEVKQVQSLIDAAKDGAEPEAAAARARWRAEKRPELEARLVRSGTDPKEASARAARAADSALKGTLTGDFVVTTEDGRNVSVSELLADPARWDGVSLLDPLDPGRRGGTPCAKFFAFGACPTINSFGHGGAVFKLVRQPVKLVVRRGRKAELVREVLQLIGAQADMFVQGGGLIVVREGRAQRLDRVSLTFELGMRAAFVTESERRGETPADVPSDVVDQALSQIGTLQSREVRAITRLPFARADGSLVLVPGFDSASGVFASFDAGAVGGVPSRPTDEDVIHAVRDIWQPLVAYPFASDDDRAGAFAALMTAVLRPALPRAPGFMVEAPTQASGKSRLALACGAVMTGREGGSTPFVAGAGGDVELAKKFVGFALKGAPFFLLDNVVGAWSSPFLSSIITDGEMTERVLGGNTLFDGPVRTMLMATANNAVLDRDFTTRFVKIRIDPNCESPQTREFSFDPVRRAVAERMNIARGVMILLRAFQQAGSPRVLRGGTRFEDWAALVRHPIGWLQSRGFAEAAGVGCLGDPAVGLQGTGTSDADTESLSELLRGLHLHFGIEPFQAREVLPLVTRGESGRDEATTLVREGVEGLVGLVGLSPKRLGRVLTFRRDRHVGGLVLRGRTARGGTTEWRVLPASS